jgi:hypothetical protein
VPADKHGDAVLTSKRCPRVQSRVRFGGRIGRAWRTAGATCGRRGARTAVSSGGVARGGGGRTRCERHGDRQIEAGALQVHTREQASSSVSDGGHEKQYLTGGHCCLTPAR